VEVRYGDRNELASITGGHVEVPVLVDDQGTVVTESRDICQHVLVGTLAERLVPSPHQGPIWAYADFCDGPLEDVLFRIASPELVAHKSTPGERALYVYVKERKFGKGCVQDWLDRREVLLTRARRLLAPTLLTLEAQPFLFGDRPTLADAALYGNLAMLEGSSPEHLPALSSALGDYARRVEAAAHAEENAMTSQPVAPEA